MVKRPKKTVCFIRKGFIQSTILRSSRVLSSKHRINPYLENIDEIWQWNVETSDQPKHGWHEQGYVATRARHWFKPGLEQQLRQTWNSCQESLATRLLNWPEPVLE